MARIHSFSQVEALEINVVAGLVRIRTRQAELVLKDQWVEFYALLGLSSIEDSLSYLDAKELAEYTSWVNKKIESVGKEVARHLSFLEKKGLAELIGYTKKTQSWRLKISTSQFTFIPSAESARSWLEEEQVGRFAQGKFSAEIDKWIGLVTEGIIYWQVGKVEKSLELFRESKECSGDLVILGAISELLEMRSAFRIEEEPEEEVYLPQCRGQLGLAINLRAEAFRSRASSNDGLVQSIVYLKRMTGRFKKAPDIAGLCMLYNMLGLLSRRDGRLNSAEMFLRYSAVLAIASSDLVTLHASLFNLGNCIFTRLKLEDDPDHRELRGASRLIAWNREIRHRLRIGGDFAQSEIALAEIELFLGNIQEAEAQLVACRKILDKLHSDFDQAGATRLEAHILFAKELATGQVRPEVKSKVLHLLETAKGIYLCSDCPDKVPEIDEITLPLQDLPPYWKKFLPGC